MKKKHFIKMWKKEYGYNILDIDDSFYVDKCSKFTTSINTDISLKKEMKFMAIVILNVLKYVHMKNMMKMKIKYIAIVFMVVQLKREKK